VWHKLTNALNWKGMAEEKAETGKALVSHGEEERWLVEIG
jgi:hypothetical protein